MYSGASSIGQKKKDEKWLNHDSFPVNFYHFVIQFFFNKFVLQFEFEFEFEFIFLLFLHSYKHI